MPGASARSNLPSLQSTSCTTSLDCPQGVVVEREALEQHLEGAAVAFVGVLALVRVEPESRRLGIEGESRGGVDEPPDEPGAGHPIHLHAGPGDPECPVRPSAGFRRLRAGTPRRARRAPVRLHSKKSTFRTCASRRRTRSSSASSDRLARHTLHLRVVRVSRGPKHLFQLGIADPVQKRGPTQRRLPSFGPNLPGQPVKVLDRIVLQWKDIDRVLQRNRPQPLEPAPDLHPEVVGLGRDLVDQQEPLPRLRSVDITVESFI